MPRVHEIKRARKSKKERKCKTCGHEIQPGEPYRYADQRVGYPGWSSVRKFWCKDHRPSRYEFIQNPKVEAHMRAEDDLLEALSGEFVTGDAVEAFGAAADAISEIAEMQRESAENIREGFGHDTQLSDEFDEKADEAEELAERMRGIDSEIQSEPDESDHEDEEDWDEEDEWEDWRDSVRGLATEVIGELQL